MSISKHIWSSLQNYTHDDILKVRRSYYAMCAQTDYMLGQVWQTAKKNGYDLKLWFLLTFVSDTRYMSLSIFCFVHTDM